jgi:uncharacterized protein (TIGR03067 family)
VKKYPLKNAKNPSKNEEKHMKTKLLFALGVTVLANCEALAQQGVTNLSERSKEDSKAMEGTWRITSFVALGKHDWRLEGKNVSIKDNKFQFPKKFAPTPAVFSIDSDVNPKHFDFVSKGALSWGIFELKGDRLRICMIQHGPVGRPEEFSSTPENRQVLMVLERAK